MGIDFANAGGALSTSAYGDTIRGLSAYTGACWVYPRSAGAGADALISFEYLDDGTPLKFTLSPYILGVSTSGRWALGTYVGGWLFCQTSAITMNVWQHVAFTMSSGTGTIYVNGVSAASGGLHNVTSAGGHKLFLGRGWSTGTPNYLDGIIADAGFWDVVLNNVEIASLAAGVSAGRVRPNRLIGHWPCYGEQVNSIVSLRSSSGVSGLLSKGGTLAAANHGPVGPYAA